MDVETYNRFNRTVFLLHVLGEPHEYQGRGSHRVHRCPQSQVAGHVENGISFLIAGIRSENISIKAVEG
jgi:hypothetical protein